MRGKYERRFCRASRETPKIIPDSHYSHESLFSLSILIGPLHNAIPHFDKRGARGDFLIINFLLIHRSTFFSLHGLPVRKIRSG